MDEQVHNSDSAAELLAEWRAAERRLAELPFGTPDWHRARLEVDDLAQRYQQLLADREDIARALAGGVVRGPESHRLRPSGSVTHAGRD